MNSVNFQLYRAILRFFGLLLVAGFCFGCARYKIPTSAFESATHPIYQVVPRHRSQVKWFDAGHWAAWALFGNDDDGLFGEGSKASYRPYCRPTWKKAAAWYLRNPLHNLCFYVVGSAWCTNSEFAFLKASKHHFEMFTYYPEAHTVFAGDETSLFLGLHGWKPFFSLRVDWSAKRRMDFYVGWRERGNFGIKFLPFAKKKKSLCESEY